MTQLTIGHLAERAGVATSAIRFYESRGLISSVRTTGNQRRYEQSTLRRVAFIRTAQRVGPDARRDRRRPGDPARRPRADEVRLAPAEHRLATPARRADRADRAAARQPRRLHRLRLPEPEGLRPAQPRRRGRRRRHRRGLPRAPRRSAMSLLHEPHHDGSPLYVADEAPALGSTVAVRLPDRRERPGRPGLAAHDVRRRADLPPLRGGRARRARRLVGGRAAGAQPGDPLPVPAAPPGRTSDSGGCSGVGIVDHDPPDAFDFRLSSHDPPPDWARDAVVYQVFPDRFARSAAADERATPEWAVPADWDDEVVFEGFDPRTPLQFFGGDLDGITEHLDHLAELGVERRLHDPGLPRREQPPLQRLDLRARRPAARRRRGLRPARDAPCTSAAGGSSAT